ncbi:unnamed protein product, partial [Heterotrigona itama]
SVRIDTHGSDNWYFGKIAQDTRLTIIINNHLKKFSLKCFHTICEDVVLDKFVFGQSQKANLLINGTEFITICA